MSLDQLITTLHANLTGNIPTPVQVTQAAPEPAPEPEQEAPRTLSEGVVKVIAEGSDITTLGPHWVELLSEACETGHIGYRETTAARGATLTPAGIALASERGWLNDNEENEMKAIDWNEALNAPANDAKAFVAANVEDYPHVEAARAAEQAGKGRKTVLAAIDKAEAEMQAEDARLDAEADAQEEAVNEALADAATAAFAEVKPAPVVTRTLAEAKAAAKALQTALSEGPTHADGKPNPFAELPWQCHSIITAMVDTLLAVPDGPAPRKAKAKAAPKASLASTYGETTAGSWIQTSRGLYRFVVSSKRVIYIGANGEWKRGNVNPDSGCSAPTESPSDEALSAVVALLKQDEKEAFGLSN